MGIRDLFRRKKDNMDVSYPQDYESTPDCVLKYRSGVNAQVSFKDIEEVALDNGTRKNLQSVLVNYDMPDGTFQRKKYYMEPIFDKDGNNITKESYLSLTNSNMPLIKGFFAKEQLEKEPTNYIGYIDYDNNGKPIRGKDTNFERGYKITLERKIAGKQKESEENFRKQMQDQVERVGYHEKTSHAEDLSNIPCPYPNRNSNNNFYR